jgi:D-alanyl-lipoteichoic acid acyltransferase DltB (MBOAT superfamily)
MMPQFARIKNKFQNYNNIARGLFIFSIGLFKKVVIADTFAIWATNGFDLAENLNLFEAWATSLSYTFQLYFDFSGYTDMAIGLALIFNIKLPINFNSPYKSTNIQDFWRRWHITLSRFLRDYLYIPLGGNKKGSLRTYCNLMATFVLGGFWHGAGWTFVFWGFLHGIALIFQRLWSKLGFKLWTWFAWLITFNFLNITWIFFRAKEWDDAIKVLSSMFSFENIVLPRLLNEKLAFLSKFQIKFGGIANNINGNLLTPIYLIAALFVIVVFKNSIYKLYKFEANYNSLLFTSFTLLISILHLTKVTDFLYFNF